MDEKLIGTWVEVELVNGKKWTGKIEEWDEEALFISNGFQFGHDNHKGAECASNEVAKVESSSVKEFSVE